MNELAWLLASWWGTRAAFTLPRRRLSSFARRLSVRRREGRDETGRDATRRAAPSRAAPSRAAPRRAGERIDSNSNVGYARTMSRG